MLKFPAVLYRMTIDKNQMRTISKTFDKSTIALRIAMNRLVRLVEVVEDNWVMHDSLNGTQEFITCTN